jgi:hypothetical protein
MKEVVLMDELKHKKLTNTYNKNGFTVKIYKPDISDDARKIIDARIKYDILDLIKKVKQK